MKILICTDGSEHSKKTMDQAALIASGCNVNEVAVLHVYDKKFDFSTLPRDEGLAPSRQDLEKFREMNDLMKEDSKKLLDEALEYLADKDIKAEAIFKEGHPAQTIVETGCGGNFDMIFMGSRGIGGLKKLFLGSVSSAVVQEAEGCTIVIVR